MMKRVKKILLAMLIVAMVSVGFTGCSGCGKEKAEAVTDMPADVVDVTETVESLEDIAESEEVTVETESSEEVVESTEETEVTEETETTEGTEESTETVKDSKEPEDTKPSDDDSDNGSDNGQTSTPIPEVHVHSWVEDITEATCDTGKVITTKCSGCGEVQGARTEGEGQGHDYVETILYGASCNAMGYSDVTCSRCKAHGPGHGDIPMLPHTFETKVWVEGDCRSPKVTQNICSICGSTEPKVEDWEVHRNDHVWITGTFQEYDETLHAWTDVETTFCEVCNMDKP